MNATLVVGNVDVVIVTVPVEGGLIVGLEVLLANVAVKGYVTPARNGPHELMVVT